MPGDEVPGLPLATVVAALRTELSQAVREGKNTEFRFALGPVELEFEFEVTAGGGADVGVRFWVLSLGGKAERSTTRSHRMRLTLTPVSAAGEDRVVVTSRLDELPE